MRLSHALSRHNRDLAAEKDLREKEAAFDATIDPIAAEVAFNNAWFAFCRVERTGNQGAIDVARGRLIAAGRTYGKTHSSAEADRAPSSREQPPARSAK